MIRTFMIHNGKTAGTSMIRHFEKHAPSFQDIEHCGGSHEKAVCTNLGHRNAAMLIANDWMTQEWFDSSFKFVFVRNTWDRMVSLFEFYRGFRLKRNRASNAALVDFPTFIKEVTTKTRWCRGPRLLVTQFDLARPQLEWLRWGADFIGRFEDLERDWKLLCETIDVVHAPLERHKTTIDKDHRQHKDYHDYYDEVLQRVVAEHYAEEIERFGFVF